MLVGMADETDQLSRLDVYANAMQHFALERGSVALTLFDSAAGKLPEQRQHRRRSALGNQIAAAVLNHGGHDSYRAGRSHVPRSVIDAEQLLTHEQDVGRAHGSLATQTHEGAVRAADVRQIDLTVRALGDAAMQAGDVAVFGKQNVAALTTAVYASLRDREGIARRVATDDQSQATDVALRRTAESLYVVGRAALALELFEANDFLANPEQITELEQAGFVRAKLEVNAVERVLVFDRQLRSPTREGRMARRQVAVASEDRPRVAAERDLGHVR